MNDRILTSVSTSLLVDELHARLLRHERDATRVRSVAKLRELVARASAAGRTAGRVEQLDTELARLGSVLDEATAGMPDVLPAAADSNEPSVKYWRDGRQHLWRIVERLREHLDEDRDALQRHADKQWAHVEQLAGEALAPEVPLRVRAGRWLYELGVRMGDRGAA